MLRRSGVRRQRRTCGRIQTEENASVAASRMRYLFSRASSWVYLIRYVYVTPWKCSLCASVHLQCASSGPALASKLTLPGSSRCPCMDKVTRCLIWRSGGPWNEVGPFSARPITSPSGSCGRRSAIAVDTCHIGFPAFSGSRQHQGARRLVTSALAGSLARCVGTNMEFEP